MSFVAIVNVASEAVDSCGEWEKPHETVRGIVGNIFSV
jgi:hypothetical protein